MQAAITRRPFQAGLAPVRPVAVPRVSVVVQAKATKAAEFRGLSNEELLGKIADLKQELASIRFLQRTRGMADPANNLTPDAEKVPRPHLNSQIRKQVAQLWTILREREMAIPAYRSRRDSLLRKPSLGA